MLDIDDLIQSDAYDDEQNHKSANYCPPMSLGIKPVPPPPPLQRKYDPVSMKVHKVVCPPKESCFSLPIIFPNLSSGNLKSRVETQIRVTVDLAHPTSSPDPTSYDRVGSWKYLKLPQGTATKRMSRKKGRIDPDPQDILYLTFSVNCASDPCSRVVSCSSCQAREAKRVAKKIAARVRPPAPSDSEADDAQPISNSNDPSNPSTKVKHEDPSSIIQFNCSPLIDFSNGTTVLPLRITCYCRHHREKVGFHVNLTLVDYSGRVVGAGTTKPIMITDDHKSGNPAKLLQQTQQQTVYSTQVGWEAPSPPATTAPSKRRTAKDTNNLTKATSKKKRVTPYDSSLKSNRHVSSRETSLSLSSAPSPDPAASSPVHDQDVSHTKDHEMSPPPEHSPATLFGQISTSTPPSSSEIPSLNYNYGCNSHSQDSQSESSPDGLITPTDLGPAPALSLDVAMLNEQMSDSDLFSSSPRGIATSTNHLLPFLSLFSSLPHNPNTIALPPPPPPVIHRLIPSCGPTHGGIEVTVLGANFHMTLVNELTCVFGGVEATSTTRWSDNALVCVLPPRAQPGVVEVEVRVGGEEKREAAQGQQPTLFTYSDESDRALMELALQVVGLKMTGKIEDAKNVAMRIVGADTNNNSSSSNTAHDNTLNGGGIANTLLTATSDFELLVIKFLSLLDIGVEASVNRKMSTHQAFRHSTQAGQTLLHLAAFVGYPKLLQFLSDRWEGDGEIDKRDKNGLSALHFAFLRLGGSTQDRERRIECAKILLNAGADREVVDALGRTAEEIGGEGVVDILGVILEGVVVERDTIEDEEAEQGHQVVEDEDEWWGDAEDDDVEYAEIGSVRDRVRKRRQLRRACKEKDQATVDSAPSLPTNEKATETDVHVQKGQEKEKEKEKIRDLGPDEKQALSFLDMLSRTMAHLPGAHALPHLPVNLPNLPLPPLAFPVMLQALFGGAPNAEQAEIPDDNDKPAVMMREWKALWEKCGLTWQTGGEAEEEAPPEYTPRAEHQESHQPEQLERCPTPESKIEEPSGSTSRNEDLQELEGPQTSRNAASKRVTTDSYQHSHVTEQDFSAYSYQPKMKAKKGFKGDKMLVLFWIPILLISLIWACHTGFQFAIRAVKSPVGWGFNKVVAGR